MLDKYKIRVNTKAESKEAQELLFELGYYWAYRNIGKKFFYEESDVFLFANVDGVIGTEGIEKTDFFNSNSAKEITLPQLRDLVVLHRNDVKDATHKYIGGGAAYKTVDDIAYLWTRMGWEYKGVAHDLVTLHKGGEQGLITGADAKLAWAKGEELEFYSPDLDMWFGLNDEPFMSDVFDTRPIRIKPHTILITLSLEIPAPFEPKEGDEVYFIDCDTKRGYSSDIIGQGCDPDWIQFGAWKSEDEIKQVVAALRSALTTQ